jgi:hypothetical protein
MNGARIPAHANSTAGSVHFTGVVLLTCLLAAQRANKWLDCVRDSECRSVRKSATATTGARLGAKRAAESATRCSVWNSSYVVILFVFLSQDEAT